jgi:hypothetical protein
VLASGPSGRRLFDWGRPSGLPLGSWRATSITGCRSALGSVN